jgi:hypothetical protein
MVAGTSARALSATGYSDPAFGNAGAGERGPDARKMVFPWSVSFNVLK